MAFYLCVAGVEYKHMAFIQHLFCRLSQSTHLLFINENSIELMFATHTHTHTHTWHREVKLIPFFSRFDQVRSACSPKGYTNIKQHIRYQWGKLIIKALINRKKFKTKFWHIIFNYNVFITGCLEFSELNSIPIIKSKLIYMFDIFSEVLIWIQIIKV
jgi:hypothetical protein